MCSIRAFDVTDRSVPDRPRSPAHDVFLTMQSLALSAGCALGGRSPRSCCQARYRDVRTGDRNSSFTFFQCGIRHAPSASFYQVNHEEEFPERVSRVYPFELYDDFRATLLLLEKAGIPSSIIITRWASVDSRKSNPLRAAASSPRTESCCQVLRSVRPRKGLE
jgi:hypothetical protein